MALQAICSETTTLGAACTKPVYRDTGLCWHHAATRAIGRDDRHDPRYLHCAATTRLNEPCAAWVVHTIPEALLHEFCVMHYYQHLHERDRKPSEGCGCFTSAGRTPRRAKSSP